MTDRHDGPDDRPNWTLGSASSSSLFSAYEPDRHTRSSPGSRTDGAGLGGTPDGPDFAPPPDGGSLDPALDDGPADAGAEAADRRDTGWAPQAPSTAPVASWPSAPWSAPGGYAPRPSADAAPAGFRPPNEPPRAGPAAAPPPRDENNVGPITYRSGRPRRYWPGPRRQDSAPTQTVGLILSVLVGGGSLLSGLEAHHPSPAEFVPSLLISLAIGLAVVRYWRRRRSRIWFAGLIGPMLAAIGLVLAIVH